MKLKVFFLSLFVVLSCSIYARVTTQQVTMLGNLVKPGLRAGAPVSEFMSTTYYYQGDVHYLSFDFYYLEEDLTFQVFDEDDNLVYETDLPSTIFSMSIDLSEYPAGTYKIVVKNENVNVYGYVEKEE